MRGDAEAKEPAVLKKVLAGVTVATVLAFSGVAIAGAVSSPAKTTTPAHGGAGNLVALAVKTAASTIGVDVKTLRADVKSGHTIAAVATQHHVSPSAVVSAIISKVDAAIDARVKSGKLSSTKAAKAKARVPALADRLVNHTTSALRGLRAGARLGYHGDKVLQAAASAIGISYTALRQAMHSGQSISAIARAHGVSPAKVANAMAAVAQQNFAAAGRAHKVNGHYAKLIPKIMTNFVDGSRGRAAVHRGVKAKARAAAKA
jgi:hypothetical protein